MEGVFLPGGTPVDLDPASEADREFARIMAADAPAGNEPPPPPKRVAPDKTDPGYTPKPKRETRARTTTASPKPKATAQPQTDSQRREGVQGLVQIAAGLCLILDQRTPEKDVSFKADAIVLASNSEPIADAVVQTARANAGFAAALDKVTSAGPYAALVSVMVGVGLQIASNHGVTTARAMGASSPEDIVAASEAA